MLNRNYMLRQSRLWFSIASNALFFTTNIAFVLSHTFFLAFAECIFFPSLRFACLYLSFFVCVCVYFHFAILDSVHILSTLSTIISLFCCFMLLLSFVVVALFSLCFALFNACFAAMRERDIVKTHYVRFCYYRFTVSLSFSFSAWNGMGNLYVEFMLE